MNLLRRAWCRDGFLLPAFHPAFMEWRMQVQARFVHKEEPEIVCEHPFLALPVIPVPGLWR
jgi:hypothetical protein